jgi:ribosomal protein L16 Arg81 hydroxylase
MSSTVPCLESDALAWILGMSDSAGFVAEKLGKAWVHARTRDPSRFAELLSLAQLDEILGTYGIRHPGVRLVRADQDVPTSEYLWRDQMVDPVQAARLFAEGATVIFGALHDRHEGMRRLCSALSRQATARTQTNIYLTPPDSQGFKPHWDTHDVFVLQVEGSKRWRIYGGGPEQPLEDQKFDPAEHAPGEVEAEFTLEAGDALYIPRGVMHAAVTTESVSLHVTLGLMAYTWSNLLVDCLSELAGRSPGWRANVPFGLARLDPEGEAARAELARRLEGLAAEVDLGAVIAERRRSFEQGFRPRTGDLMRQALRAEEIGTRDLVRWREGTPATLATHDGRVVLEGPRREVDFPASAARTLQALIDGGALQAGAIEDGLDWESRRVVLAALAREGFVAVERSRS